MSLINNIQAQLIENHVKILKDVLFRHDEADVVRTRFLSNPPRAFRDMNFMCEKPRTTGVTHYSVASNTNHPTQYDICVRLGRGMYDFWCRYLATAAPGYDVDVQHMGDTWRKARPAYISVSSMFIDICSFYDFCRVLGDSFPDLTALKNCHNTNRSFVVDRASQQYVWPILDRSLAPVIGALFGALLPSPTVGSSLSRYVRAAYR